MNKKDVFVIAILIVFAIMTWESAKSKTPEQLDAIDNTANIR